jgi:hypothetical protein
VDSNPSIDYFAYLGTVIQLNRFYFLVDIVPDGTLSANDALANRRHFARSNTSIHPVL